MMKKIWRYKDYDPTIRKVKAGKVYKNPEVYQIDSPGEDYIEVTEEVLVERYNQVDIDKTEYEIKSDVDSTIAKKDIRTINYKTELKNNVTYTPEFIIHDNGIFSGLLDKTNYYRNYEDENNKGTLVLQIQENYVIDETNPSEYNSAKSALERTKIWKHAKKAGGLEEDERKQKTRKKKYNTRRKRHKEGNRRRNNIMEQLIDNIGLAGVLSGTFTSASDAHIQLAAMQSLLNAEFSTWLNSGKGPIYDALDATDVSWLSNVIPSTPHTLALCPWMIGLMFKDYIKSKLKGDIK